MVALSNFSGFSTMDLRVLEANEEFVMVYNVAAATAAVVAAGSANEGIIGAARMVCVRANGVVAA
jgi:hypothetical protein